MIEDQEERRTSDCEEFFKNAAVLIIAGTETTSSWLTGIFYYLLSNPSILREAVEEVRERFARKEDITTLSVQSLGYMKACMKEAMRMYPPVRFGAPRRVPGFGDMICGQCVPGNTVVGVHQWATYRGAKNFKDPDEYKPQRWLGGDEFAGDKLDAVKGWGFGPRTCIAKR